MFANQFGVDIGFEPARMLPHLFLGYGAAFPDLRLALSLLGFFLQASLIDIPFFVAGALEILYDIVLYQRFAALRPPEGAD